MATFNEQMFASLSTHTGLAALISDGDITRLFPGLLPTSASGDIELPAIRYLEWSHDKPYIYSQDGRSVLIRPHYLFGCFGTTNAAVVAVADQLILAIEEFNPAARILQQFDMPPEQSTFISTPDNAMGVIYQRIVVAEIWFDTSII